MVRFFSAFLFKRIVKRLVGILPKFITNERTARISTDDDTTAATTSDNMEHHLRQHRANLDEKTPASEAAANRFCCRRCRADLFYVRLALYIVKKLTHATCCRTHTFFTIRAHPLAQPARI